ncbi:MAG TPA: alcohol dehydrogenase catalytic domain-containing protein [Actinopolymorphaceae bacterium]
MRAAVLKAARQIEVAGVAEPRRGPADVLVQMRAVGICGSDVHAFRGHHPFRKPPVVLGHEGAGVVVAAAENGRLAPGDRVAIMPVLSCWECGSCEEGLPHLCHHKRVPGAGWQGLLEEYVAAPERVLFPLPDDVSYAEGAMIEPAAVAWHTVRMAGVVPRHRVAVLGAGAIGSLVAGVCRLENVAQLMVSDIRQQALERAQALVPRCVPVNVERDGDVVAIGRELTGGVGFDVVVVASGHATCMDEALRLCRPRGVIVVLPMFERTVRCDLNPAVLHEIVIRGSTIYTPADYRSAAEAVCSRRLDVRAFLSEPLPLTMAQAAFELLDSGRSERVKIHLDPAG